MPDTPRPIKTRMCAHGDPCRESMCVEYGRWDAPVSPTMPDTPPRYDVEDGGVFPVKDGEWMKAADVVAHIDALTAAVPDVDVLRRAIYAVSLRHDWEHTTDREDRTPEIVAEYRTILTEEPRDA